MIKNQIFFKTNRHINNTNLCVISILYLEMLIFDLLANRILIYEKTFSSIFDVSHNKFYRLNIKNKVLKIEYLIFVIQKLINLN